MKESLKRKEKGFTLVELLAVIVILAIILVIAVPKIMDVINDSKKATLESTTKMIASAAEKAKIQNAILGKEDEITCDSVAQLNDADYGDCEIEFNGDEASVTIEGTGKFAGLYVCSGTKTISTATEEDCSSSIITGVTTITNLLAQESTLNNGLQEIIIDPSTSTSTSTSTAMQNLTGTINAGIRYVGENPNNKVYYNCEDKYNGISYGKSGYDYANACEVWRIIGVFDVKSSTSGTTEKRIKIINTESTFQASWDSSGSGTNSGYGINQWGESGDYLGADLMQLLNGYYIGKENSTCTYCNGNGQETCSQTCDSDSLKSANMKVLTNTAKGLIENAVWDTYGVKWPDGDTTSNFASTAYLEEKGISTQYTGISECSSCSDGVERTTSWTGLVGLMSVSDITYADGWLYNQSGSSLYPWSISPLAYSANANRVWFAYGGNARNDYACRQYGVFASIYLKSDIQIIGGDGNTIPYKLSA